MDRNYRNATLASASGVQLIIALYDGLIRFLGDAAAASSQGDVARRREASRKALDILVHLQATLRPGVGGRPAEVLAEFYASIFANVLRASRAAAPGEFYHAIRCVRTVRDAWQKVSLDPAVESIMPFDLQTREEKVNSGSREMVRAVTPPTPGSATRWTA